VKGAAACQRANCRYPVREWTPAPLRAAGQRLGDTHAQADARGRKEVSPVDPAEIDPAPGSSGSELTSLRKGQGYGECPSQIVRRTERKDAKGKIGSHEPLNRGVEGPVTTTHDDTIDLAGVAPDQLPGLGRVPGAVPDHMETKSREAAFRLG
jgi:hypothetical protein